MKKDTPTIRNVLIVFALASKNVLFILRLLLDLFPSELSKLESIRLVKTQTIRP